MGAAFSAWLLGSSAWAHTSSGPAGAPEGVAIPAITHGQMPVIADYASAILALAERQPNPSEDFQRVHNYSRLQRSYCLWGLMPFSIRDEESPFNICSHAYLAGLRDLVLRMNASPDNAAARKLVDQISYDMMVSGSALEICAYSASQFDTAQLVPPLWANVPTHVPSLLVIAAFLAILTVMSGVLLLKHRQS
jgi:hypothetical protein